MPVWLLRWIPTAALVVGVAGIATYGVHFFREQGRDEYRPRVAELERQLEAEKVSRARAEKASASYRAELDTLSNRPVPRVPVRLCVPTPAGNAAQRVDGPAAASGSDNRPAGGDLEAGPDIGPDLYALARDCDAENAKLRALQGWINDVR